MTTPLGHNSDPFVSPFENGTDISEAWQWPVYDAKKDSQKPLVWMPVI